VAEEDMEAEDMVEDMELAEEVDIMADMVDGGEEEEDTVVIMAEEVVITEVMAQVLTR
jgi:hypothetical protein